MKWELLKVKILSLFPPFMRPLIEFDLSHGFNFVCTVQLLYFNVIAMFTAASLAAWFAHCGSTVLITVIAGFIGFLCRKTVYPPVWRWMCKRWPYLEKYNTKEDNLIK